MGYLESLRGNVTDRRRNQPYRRVQGGMCELVLRGTTIGVVRNQLSIRDQPHPLREEKIVASHVSLRSAPEALAERKSKCGIDFQGLPQLTATPKSRAHGRHSAFGRCNTT